MNQNIAREVVNPKGGEGRGTRSKKLTGKGVTWKCGVPFERWGRINGRSIRKYATIECLLFSSRNVEAMEEEMDQFNDLFKMKRIMHSWKTKLEPKMMNELMRLTNRSFPLRVKYHAGWRMLKKITTQKVNLKKKRSSASRKTQVSTTSKESRSSRWSKSFKEKELGDKDRVAELAVDT